MVAKMNPSPRPKYANPPVPGENPYVVLKNSTGDEALLAEQI
jgi:hypothetical protein